MSNQIQLSKPWEAIDNRTAKVGVGAYLTSATTTPVTTTYTKLLGIFNNVELEGFEFDATSGKLKYNPDDGTDRTFLLTYSGNVECPSPNDEVTVGIEVTTDSVASIVLGTETSITCRSSNSPYAFDKTFPLSLTVGDLIEIQVKGDSSFTLQVDEFSTTLTKFY